MKIPNYWGNVNIKKIGLRAKKHIRNMDFIVFPKTFFIDSSEMKRLNYY